MLSSLDCQSFSWIVVSGTLVDRSRARNLRIPVADGPFLFQFSKQGIPDFTLGSKFDALVGAVGISFFGQMATATILVGIDKKYHATK